MLKGRWESCTPEWVAEWDACGDTVRRPKLVLSNKLSSIFGPEEFVMSGHEHLMVHLDFSDSWIPLPHESGGPS